MWISCLLCWGCIDEITIDLPEASQQQLVVEGTIERDQKNYIFWALVSNTLNVTGEGTFEEVDSDVRIIYNDEHTIHLIAGQEERIPIDLFHTTFGGTQENAQFHLEARVAGEVYLSENVSLVPVPTADSLSVGVEVRPELNMTGNIISVPYVQLKAHTPLINDVGQRTSLQWQVTSVYRFIEAVRDSDPFYQPKVCYMPYDGFRNDVNIANAQEFAGKDRIDEIVIAENRNDFRFSQTIYFTVVQKSLSQDAIEYWTEVKASNERSGNLYDVFPGKIRSNIQQEGDPEALVNGYFQASAIDTMRLRVRARDVEFPRRFCFMWEEPEIIDPDSPDPCLNCLKLGPGVSLERPWYWEL